MENDIQTAMELYRQGLDRLIAQHVDDVQRLKALARQFDQDSKQLAKACGL